MLICLSKCWRGTWSEKGWEPLGFCIDQLNFLWTGGESTTHPCAAQQARDVISKERKLCARCALRSQSERKASRKLLQKRTRWFFSIWTTMFSRAIVIDLRWKYNKASDEIWNLAGRCGTREMSVVRVWSRGVLQVGSWPRSWTWVGPDLSVSAV